METNECKHQYPRTMENKVRVCVLCGHAEETNELPEGWRTHFDKLDSVIRHASNPHTFMLGFKSALQSKEEEVARMKNICQEVIDLGKETAKRIEDLEEQLKAKDEEIDELSQNVDNLNEACERAYGTIERLMDLLLKAEPAIPDGFPVVDEIRRELSAYDTTDSHEEIIKRRFDTIDSLTSENNELKKRLSEIEKPT